MIVTDSTHEDIKERLVALARDLILIPSIPSRPEDRQRCYEFIRNHLESLEHIKVREFTDNGIPSLIAAPDGCHNPEVLMCGHLDVITHPDISVYRSEIKDGRIYGPGAGDMKGALAILLEVFRIIHSRSKDISLGIAVTADEETGGESGIGYLYDKQAVRCKSAMIPDGGSLNQITVEEKGILHLQVKCKGHTAHAARPWLGDNPIEKLMDQLTELRKYFNEMKITAGHWFPTCAITIMDTENKTVNRIASEASAVLDVRFPPPYTMEKMLEKIKEILSDDIEVEKIIGAEPTHLFPDALYQRVTEEVTGQSVELIKDDGGSDARFLAKDNIPVMISRPLVGNLHAQDEWIDIESMVKFYQIYERYLTQKFLK